MQHLEPPAGSGGGVDFVKYGDFAQELKLHGPNTWIEQWYLDKASTTASNTSWRPALFKSDRSSIFGSVRPRP